MTATFNMSSISSSNSTSGGISAATTTSSRRLGSAVTDYDVCVKSIVIGDSGVGKSSLLYRYTDHDWNPHYIATIGVDFKVLTFERRGKIVKLQLWDTAGQDRFRSITQSYYRGSHAVMLVFDVTNRESFDNVRQWVADVRRFGGDQLPMVLVGNKCDCDAQRQVTDAEAADLAAALGCKYVRASAKDNCNVDAAFEGLVDDCVEAKLRLLDARDPKKRLAIQPAAAAGAGASKRKSSGPCEC